MSNLDQTITEWRRQTANVIGVPIAADLLHWTAAIVVKCMTRGIRLPLAGSSSCLMPMRSVSPQPDTNQRRPENTKSDKPTGAYLMDHLFSQSISTLKYLKSSRRLNESSICARRVEIVFHNLTDINISARRIISTSIIPLHTGFVEG
jgi:hypothetical protein